VLIECWSSRLVHPNLASDKSDISLEKGQRAEWPAKFDRMNSIFVAVCSIVGG